MKTRRQLLQAGINSAEGLLSLPQLNVALLTHSQRTYLHQQWEVLGLDAELGTEQQLATLQAHYTTMGKNSPQRISNNLLAKVCRMPSSTFRLKVKRGEDRERKFVPGKPGRPRILSIEEEERLVAYIKARDAANNSPTLFELRFWCLSELSKSLSFSALREGLLALERLRLVEVEREEEEVERNKRKINARTWGQSVWDQLGDVSPKLLFKMDFVEPPSGSSPQRHVATFKRRGKFSISQKSVPRITYYSTISLAGAPAPVLVLTSQSLSERLKTHSGFPFHSDSVSIYTTPAPLDVMNPQTFITYLNTCLVPAVFRARFLNKDLEKAWAALVAESFEGNDSPKIKQLLKRHRIKIIWLQPHTALAPAIDVFTLTPFEYESLKLDNVSEAENEFAVQLLAGLTAVQKSTTTVANCEAWKKAGFVVNWDAKPSVEYLNP